MTEQTHTTVSVRGRRTYLRPPHKETDLVFIQRTFEDPRVRRNLAYRPPVSLAAEEKWLESLTGSDDIIFTICLPDGTPIGLTGLHSIHPVYRSATTGTWLAPAYWGQGLGTDAKMSLLKYAFDTCNLRKICSAAVAFNKRSVGHNLNCGYRVEGRLRQHYFVNGRYYDSILLACFRDWWEPKWRAYWRRR